MAYEVNDREVIDAARFETTAMGVYFFRGDVIVAYFDRNVFGNLKLVQDKPSPAS